MNAISITIASAWPVFLQGLALSFGLIVAIYGLTFVAAMAGDEFKAKEVAVLATVLARLRLHGAGRRGGGRRTGSRTRRPEDAGAARASRAWRSRRAR